MSYALQIGLIAVALVVVGYQAYVTIRVWRSNQFSTAQKWMQTILIWVLPALGAFVAHLVLRAAPQPLHDSPFVESGAAYGGESIGSPPTVN